MKIRGLYGVLVVGLMLMLVGCSAEAESDASEDKWLPEGVENGTVDEEFYYEIIRFYEESNDMHTNQQLSVVEINPSYGRLTDIGKRKEIISEIKEYNSFLDSFRFSHDTDVEKKITELAEQSIAKRKEINLLIDVSVSLNDKATYGLLLGDQEELEVIDDELESLLLFYDLGKEQ